MKQDTKRIDTSKQQRIRNDNDAMLSILCIPFRKLALIQHPIQNSAIQILRTQQNTFAKLNSVQFNQILDQIINGDGSTKFYQTLAQNIDIGLFQQDQCKELHTKLKTFTQQRDIIQCLYTKIENILSKKEYISYKSVDKPRNVGNLQCVFCRQPLKVNGYVNVVPFICDYCNEGNNLCHLSEITVVGLHRSLGICPRCLLRNEWQSKHPKWNRVEHSNLLIDNEYYCVTSINYDEDSKSLIWINNQLITTRVCVFIKGNKPHSVSHINTVCYPLQNEFIIPTGYYIDMYFKEFGASITLSNNNVYHDYKFGIENARFIVSNIGSLHYNGFVHLLHSIDELIPNLKQIIEKYQSSWQRLCNEITDGTLQNTFCQAVYSNKTSKILSIGSSYKSYKTCYGLIKNTKQRKRKKLIDSKKHNFQFYFDHHTLSKLKKGYKIVNQRDRAKAVGKVYVADPKNNNNNGHKVLNVPEVKQYLQLEYPEILHALAEIKFAITLIMYMIGKHVPVLSFMYELIRNTDPTGSFFGNTDLLHYTAKHIVSSHVDSKGLLDKKLDLYKLVYAVLKTDLNHDDISILCNESNILNCHSAGKHRNNGHFELKSGSLYFMVNRGVYGGVSHCIHGKDQGTGRVQHGHTKDTNTIVFRPMT